MRNKQARQASILQTGIEGNIDLAPMTKKVHLQLIPPSLSDNSSDIDRLRHALAPLYGNFQIPFRLWNDISATCRAYNWEFTALLGRSDQGWALLGVEGGDSSDLNYGLSIDIGTTTVVCKLLDMKTGKSLGVVADYNGQLAYGEDVLSRVFHAMEPGGREQLQQAVLATINQLIQRLCGEFRVNQRQITAITIGANTIMIHLFLGLDPTHICREPYIPVINNGGFLKAGEIGLDIYPEGIVYCLPNVSSYVGGDVVAGILVSGMHKRQELSLLVDIGTNGEIILGNEDWLVACAGAAGPALEGGVVAAGMRAEPGAIDKIRIEPDGTVAYTVIGGAKPLGICGSGLVDCLSEMLLTGIIDRAGQFVDDRDVFTVVTADHSGTGTAIAISQNDINNIMRTKGAVNAAIEVLLEGVGCGMQDISYFYAAGAFGRYIDLESAITIGLYPDLPRERMIQLGNSSLEGARQVLLSEPKIGELEAITSKITYFELNSNQSFMNKFVGCKFFPHTNLDFYPSVKAKLAAKGLLK